LGIGRTFQNIRLFANLTALENVMVGIDAHNRAGVGRSMLGTRSQRREEQMTTRRAEELLSFVGIVRYANELAKNLAYGDQRRLEIARAMGTNPSLLMLDEPAAGMNPAEKAELMRLIQDIRNQGLTVLAGFMPAAGSSSISSAGFEIESTRLNSSHDQISYAV